MFGIVMRGGNHVGDFESFRGKFPGVSGQKIDQSHAGGMGKDLQKRIANRRLGLFRTGRIVGRQFEELVELRNLGLGQGVVLGLLDMVRVHGHGSREKVFMLLCHAGVFRQDRFQEDCRVADDYLVVRTDFPFRF